VLSPPELAHSKSNIYPPWSADDMLTSGFLRVPVSPENLADKLVVALRKLVQAKQVDFEVKNNTIVGRVYDGKFTNMASFHISIYSVPPSHNKNANDMEVDQKCVVYMRRQDKGDYFLYARFEAKLVAFLKNLPQLGHKADESLMPFLEQDDNDASKSDNENQGEDDDAKLLFSSILPSSPKKAENSDSQYVKQLFAEACDVAASPEMSHNALDDLLALLDTRGEYFQKSLQSDAEMVMREVVGVAMESLDVQQVRGLVQLVLSMLQLPVISTIQQETREKMQASLQQLQEMWLQGREKRFGSEDTCFFTLRVFPSQQIAAICEECLTCF